MNDPSNYDPSKSRPAGPTQRPDSSESSPPVVTYDLSPAVDSAPSKRTVRRPPGLSPLRSTIDLVIVLLLIATSDVLVFQSGAQFTGVALCVLLWSAVILVVKRKALLHVPAAFILFPMAALCIKLVWSGSMLAILALTGLLGCLAMTASTSIPWLPEAILAYPCAVSGAVERAMRFRFIGAAAAVGVANERASKVGGIAAVIIPSALLVAFSGLFIMANPDLLSAFQLRIEWLSRQIGGYLSGINPGQVIFWNAAGWIGLGLLYPYRARRLRSLRQRRVEANVSSHYAVYRNTLVSVNVLFAVYLAFEFSTMWFRTFPENFYYAGYAHQGAFWLTVALALSTVTLSMIFNAGTSADPRLSTLTRLALSWSALNLVLSVAVINRLWIYVGYNGLTRLRIVGFLGIAAVVSGFILVVFKVCRNKDFVWLIHRQLWCPFAAVICYAVLPVDWISNLYNVAQVQSGDTKCVVQLAAHEYSAEGALPLLRLLDHEEAVIRDGARALVTECYLRTDETNSMSKEQQSTSYTGWESALGHSSPWLSRHDEREFGPEAANKAPASSPHWLRFQGAEALLHREVMRRKLALRPFAESSKDRLAAIDALYRHAYQWY